MFVVVDDRTALSHFADDQSCFAYDCSLAESVDHERLQSGSLILAFLNSLLQSE